MLFFQNVHIMQNPQSFPICRTHVFYRNTLVHMCYIYSNKNLYINTSKKKSKCVCMGATPATTLKTAPAGINLSHPRCFYMGATWVRQHATNLFFHSIFCYLIDMLGFTFCRMSHPCLRSSEIQKNRKNG